MATIRDVAQRAGVSITTVSHVINETRFVSPELRQRVQSVMAELDYQPNALARSLRRKQTHTLGMILPDSANPFFAEIARAIQRASFARGYSIILCNSDGDLDKELVYANVLMEKQVDGIIFVAAGLSTEHIQAIRDRDVPVVIVDRDLPHVEADAVLSDNLGGGYAATTHLLQLGRRRIGCITGPSDVTPSADRVMGYRQALAEYGIPVDEALFQRGDFQFAGGAAAMHYFLSLSEPPDAVFACNDLMAIGAMRVATAYGQRMPEDLAIVGFDDVPLASYSNPPLTTVAQPKQEMSELAIDLLMTRIAGQDMPPQRRVLPTRLVVRHSSTGQPDFDLRRKEADSDAR